MKTSELIAWLTKMKAEHGDLPVVSHGYENMAEITEVSFEEPDDEYPLGYYWLE